MKDHSKDKKHIACARFPDNFTILFSRGVLLLERISAYEYKLSTASSEDAKPLSHCMDSAKCKYLITKAIQLVSWLLIQRAFYEGDMTQSQAIVEQSKVCIDVSTPNFLSSEHEHIPREMLIFAEQLIDLQQQIKEFSTSQTVPAYQETVKPVIQQQKQAIESENYVAQQLDTLRSAFSNLRERR